MRGWPPQPRLGRNIDGLGTGSLGLNMDTYTTYNVLVVGEGAPNAERVGAGDVLFYWPVLRANEETRSFKVISNKTLALPPHVLVDRVAEDIQAFLQVHPLRRTELHQYLGIAPQHEELAWYLMHLRPLGIFPHIDRSTSWGKDAYQTMDLSTQHGPLISTFYSYNVGMDTRNDIISVHYFDGQHIRVHAVADGNYIQGALYGPYAQPTARILAVWYLGTLFNERPHPLPMGSIDHQSMALHVPVEVTPPVRYVQANP